MQGGAGGAWPGEAGQQSRKVNIPRNAKSPTQLMLDDKLVRKRFAKEAIGTRAKVGLRSRAWKYGVIATLADVRSFANPSAHAETTR